MKSITIENHFYFHPPQVPVKLVTSKGSDVKMAIQTNRRHDHNQSHKLLRTVYTFYHLTYFSQIVKIKKWSQALIQNQGMTQSPPW